MAKLVIIPGAVRSKLITTIELGARLRQAGHDVTVIAPDDPVVDATGLECLRSNLRLALQAPCTGDRAARIAQCRAAVAAADVAGFAKLLAGINPDLVIIDIEAHAHIMTTVQSGYRVALLSVFFNLHKYPQVPPVHLPMTPGVGLSGTRLGIELGWWRYRLWRWRELRVSRHHGADYLALLEAFAQRIGFSLATQVDYYQGLLPFTYRHLPIINTNMLELELPLPEIRDTRCHYVGPMTSVDRQSFAFTRQEQPVVDKISALADEVRRAGPPHKLIYCGFGSYYFGDDSDFLTRVVQGLGKHPEWIVILGLGGRLPARDLPSLPANVHAFSWAPQMHALALADCAIVHGGMTTIYECIHSATPMLVYPYAEIFDQYGTAVRTGFRGVGLVGDRQRDTPEIIARRTQQVLDDTSLHARVSTAREDMHRYIADKRLAVAIEQILSGDKHTAE